MPNNNITTTDNADEFKYFSTHVRLFFNHASSRTIKAIEASPNYVANDSILMVDEDREKLMYDYISNEKQFILRKMLKSKNEKARLDTHKLCAIFTLAILKYCPITLNDKDNPKEFKREALYANELLATEVSFIMLLMYQIHRATDKYPNKESVRRYLFENMKYSFRLPNQMHDKFDVLNGFIRSLRSIDYNVTSEQLYPTERLIAQIYFFIDSYNKDTMYDAISIALNKTTQSQPDIIWTVENLPPQELPPQELPS